MENAQAEQKFTEPAPRYSEATLIKELESNGIGRPSTYATIVNTIQVRHYVDKEKGKLIPTELGFKINDYLVSSLPDLFQVGFTASMEDKLDHVESGEIQWTNMLSDFYGQFSKWLGEAKNADAPEKSKAEVLLQMLSGIQEWAPAEKTEGKRAFDDQKFFQSVQKKHEKSSTISGKQWAALLALAVKYHAQLPNLAETAEKNGFSDDLAEAEKKAKEQEIAREEWKLKRQEAEAAAPPQENLAEAFKAMDSVQWAAPEKRRGRTYDDKKFFDSLKKQKEAGKSLSEKQLAALWKLMEKYADQIPDAQNLFERLGIPSASAENAAAEDSSAENAERKQQAEKILESFSKFTQWAEPVKRGRRVYDDKAFVESLAKQAAAGKILSERQMAALLKTAAKYGIS